MNQRAKSVLIKIGLFLSACLAGAGLVGFVIVIKMGVWPSGNPMGHSKAYVQGWTLFFLLLMGLPCLAAFFGGLIPWIIWFIHSRKKIRRERVSATRRSVARSATEQRNHATGGNKGRLLSQPAHGLDEKAHDSKLKNRHPFKVFLVLAVTLPLVYYAIVLLHEWGHGLALWIQGKSFRNTVWWMVAP